MCESSKKVVVHFYSPSTSPQKETNKQTNFYLVAEESAPVLDRDGQLESLSEGYPDSEV